ncbi:MAG: cytochrome c3 family protein [Desulfobacterales bacterium]|nr:cytochrome c3 family protein [Desulfobacterales bacterium]
MQKVVFSLVCFVMAIICGSVMVVSGQEDAEDMCVPMGTIELGAPDGVEQKRSPVGFPHARHFDFECQTCHHTWDNTSQIQGCMTAGCHDAKEAATKTKQGAPLRAEEIRYFKKAYHESCIGCHKIMKLRNQKIEMSGKKLDGPLPNPGPTSCIGCHPKEE